MKRIILVAVLILLLFLGAFFLFMNQKTEDERESPTPGEQTVLPATEPEKTTAPNPAPESTVVEPRTPAPLPNTGGQYVGVHPEPSAGAHGP